MKIYYARPISLYGTPQDQRDIALIKSMGFDVINPNKEQLAELYKQKGMNIFTDIIDSEECDGVAFRAFPDGSISAGVYKEIKAAYDCEKIVFELPTITQSRVLSVEDTRAYLTYLGQR